MNYNPKLPASVIRSLKEVSFHLGQIEEYYDDLLDDGFPFTEDLQEVMVKVNGWGKLSEGDPYRNQPLIPRVATAINCIYSQEEHLIEVHPDGDYWPKDVIGYVEPLLRSEKVAYDVSYNPDMTAAFILIHQ